MSIKYTGAAALFSLLGSSVLAETISYSDSFFSDDYVFDAKTLSIRQFDPTLGDLETVSLHLSASLLFEAGIENLDSAPSDADFTLGTDLFVAESTSSGIYVETQPLDHVSISLAGFDGVLDYDGASGETLSDYPVAGFGLGIITASDQLDALTGTGSLAFIAESLAQSFAEDTLRFSSNLNWDASASINVGLRVDYTYSTPSVATVPIPAGLPMLGLALLGLGLTRRRI